MGAGGPVGVGIGRLRDRVTLQSPVRTKGATGQQKVTGWADEATVYAQVTSETAGRDVSTHAQQTAVGDFTVTVRGGIDVLEDWRVLWAGRVLAVVAVLRSGSGPANPMKLHCRELQGATA
jgi:head-tail adaptor